MALRTKTKTVATTALTEVKFDRLRAMRKTRGLDYTVATVGKEVFERGVDALLDEEMEKASAQAAA